MNKETKLKSADVLPFARLGNSNGPSGGDNYLLNMKNGTRFLASRKALNDSVLHDFIVASDPKSMPAVFICENNGGVGEFRFVDPHKFVRDYEFYMTLEVVEMPDGNSNQIPTGTVASDDRHEVVSEVHVPE